MAEDGWPKVEGKLCEAGDVVIKVSKVGIKEVSTDEISDDLDWLIKYTPHKESMKVLWLVDYDKTEADVICKLIDSISERTSTWMN